MASEPTQEQLRAMGALFGGLFLASIGLVWNGVLRANLGPNQPTWVAREPQILGILGTGIAVIGMIVLATARRARKKVDETTWADATIYAIERGLGYTVGAWVCSLLAMQPMTLLQGLVIFAGSFVVVLLIRRFRRQTWENPGEFQEDQ